MSQSVILILVLVVLVAISCATLRVPTYDGDPSDHFDGKRFFNSDGPGMGDFRELMKYNRKNKRSQWEYQDEESPIKSKLEDFNEKARIRYFHINHASILLQIDGINILTDPVYFKRASPFSWTGPKRYRAPGIPFDLLPRIDVVVLSHDHYDHLDINTLKRLQDRDDPLIIAGLGHLNFLKKFKLSNVKEMDWHETKTFKGLDFTFTPAVHWSNRAFSPRKTLWGSYVIKGSSSIYFAGDTAYSDHFKDTKERYGSFDLALIPIGAYVPRSFMLHVHMDPQQASQVHLDLEARESYAIHWGTFQLTHEGMFDPIQELEAACAEKAIENFYFDLSPGIEHVYSRK